jgi:hypothetical protein
LQSGLVGADIDSARRDLKESLQETQNQLRKFFDKKGTEKSLVEIIIEGSLNVLNDEIKKRLVGEFEEGDVKKKIIELFNPKNQASLLGSLKEELVKKINPDEKDSPLKKLSDKLDDLITVSNKLQTDVGTLIGQKETPKAGMNFQELVLERLKRIATVTRDTLENLTAREGAIVGKSGRSKVGDFCLKSPSGKIVIEAKSEQKVQIETILDDSIKNRNADAAIIVFDESNPPAEVKKGHYWDGQTLLDGRGFLTTLGSLDSVYSMARAFMEIHKIKSEIAIQKKRNPKGVNWKQLIQEIESGLSESIKVLNEETAKIATQASNLSKTHKDLLSIKNTIASVVVERLAAVLKSVQNTTNS